MNSVTEAQTGRRARASVVFALIACLAAVALLAQCGGSDSVGLSLKDLGKEQYTLQVAQAYAGSRDLEQARAQLEELDVPNVRQWVVYVADSYIAAGRDKAEIQALAELAGGLGVESPQMIAYLATATPLPTDTPLPTATPRPTDTPTATPLPPTETPTAPPPTETPTLAPTSTLIPTPAPPTKTPKPKATSKPKPTATKTPVPGPEWTWTARLVGPGENGQECDGTGNLQIRVTVLDAKGAQIPGVWIYDKYSPPEVQYQVTGNVGSPDWGPGETKYEYGQWGGGSLCVAQGQGGPCASDFTRDMPCFVAPPVEDLFAAGYCNCCKAGATLDECREYAAQKLPCATSLRHYAWRVVFKHNR
jgi:hypothetical protein